MESYQKYFNPQTLSSLRGLELKARLIVEGYVAGLHKSPYHGFSIEFAERLLDETGVVVTPGVGYGSHGEGYVRLSLTVPDGQMEEGIRRLRAFRWE